MFLKNSNFEFCSKTIRLKKSHGKEFRIQFKQTASNLLQPVLNYSVVINTFFFVTFAKSRNVFRTCSIFFSIPSSKYKNFILDYKNKFILATVVKQKVTVVVKQKQIQLYVHHSPPSPPEFQSKVIIKLTFLL